jgi:hypothetical protein
MRQTVELGQKRHFAPPKSISPIAKLRPGCLTLQAMFDVG